MDEKHYQQNSNQSSPHLAQCLSCLIEEEVSGAAQLAMETGSTLK